jgi:hypothetical protein
MKLAHSRLWHLLLPALILLLAGCGTPTQEEQLDEGAPPPPPPPPENVTVQIISPDPLRLDPYGIADPELIYIATEGEEGRAIPVARLVATIHDLEEELRTGSLELTSLESGSRLPPVPDGVHELEFIVNDENGNPKLTVITRYATDTLPPEIDLIAPANEFLTNDSTPLLEYTISDPCFASAACDEEVFVDGNGTDRRNGQELPELKDGLHKLTVQYTDPAGHTAEASSTFAIDSTPPLVVFEDPGAEEELKEEEPPPPPPGNDPVVPNSTVNTDVGDLNFSADEPGKALIYLDPDEDCEALILEGGGAEECAQYELASVSFEESELTSVAIAELTVGEHVIMMVALDSLGNLIVQQFTFTKADIHAPAVVVAEPEGLKSTTTVPLDFTALDDATPQSDLEVVWQLSIKVLESGEWTEAAEASIDLDAGTLTVAGDGDYLLSITATDEGGNGTTVSTEFTVDTTAPFVAVEAPEDGSTLPTATPELLYSWEELNPGDEAVFLFAGAFVETNVSASYQLPVGSGDLLRNADGSDLPEGEHTVVVKLTDLAGNANLVPETGTSGFTVNALGPDVAILDPQDGQVFSAGDVTIQYRAEEFSRVEFWVAPTGQPASGELVHVREFELPEPTDHIYSDTINFAEDGDYTIRLVAIDDSGVQPESVAAISLLVDSQLPAIAISSPNAADRHFRPDETVSLDYDVTNATSLEILLDGAKLEDVDVSTSPPISLGPFEQEGTHTIRIEVTNHNGSNVDEQTFVIDGTAPVVTILNPGPDTHFSGSSITLNFAVEEANGLEKQTVWLDREALEGVASGDTLYDLPAGNHTIEVQVEDLAGNQSEVAAVRFVVDTKPPQVTIHAPKKNAMLGTTSVTLRYEVDDNRVARETVWLDDSEQEDAKSGDTFHGLGQGPHSFRVEAEDLAGNISDPAIVRFTVDSLAPVVTLSSPRDGATYSSNSVTLDYSIAEGNGVASETVWLDDAKQTGMRSGDVLTNLGSGTHTVAVLVEDLAGNQSVKASATFIIDGTAPVVTILSPEPGAAVPSGSVTLRYELSEANGVAGEKVWLDEKQLRDFVSGDTVTGLADGAHFFEVQATDSAGNASGVAGVRFIVDTTAPAVFITSPEDGATFETTSVKLTYRIEEEGGVAGETVWLDGKEQTGARSGHTLHGLGYGVHTVDVQVADRATNLSRIARVEFAVVEPEPVDATPPDVTIISPADGQILPTGSATLTYRVEEEGGIAGETVVLDGEEKPGMRSGAKLEGLAPGPHFVEVQAVDVAGNRSPFARADFSVEEPPPPSEGIVPASRDSNLRLWHKNSNEGGSPQLVVSHLFGGRRAVVGFDLSEVSTSDVQSAILVLTVDPNDPPSNWGQAGRTVDAHAMLEDWSEGGVTWNCADDTDVENNRHDCDSKWKGGSYQEQPSSWVLHTNGMTGTVEWDVTEDVRNGVSSWLLKKHRSFGNVRYFSKEGAAAADDMGLAPKLILSDEPSAGTAPIVTFHTPNHHHRSQTSLVRVGYSVYAPTGIETEEAWLNGEPLELKRDGHRHGHRHWYRHGEYKKHNIHKHWLRLWGLDPGEYELAVQVTDDNGNKSELTQVKFTIRDPKHWKSGSVSCVREDHEDDDDEEGFWGQVFKCAFAKK